MNLKSIDNLTRPMLQTLSKFTTSVKPLNTLVNFVADKALHKTTAHACTPASHWMEYQWICSYNDDKCVSNYQRDQQERACFRCEGSGQVICNSWVYNGNWGCC